MIESPVAIKAANLGLRLEQFTSQDKQLKVEKPTAFPRAGDIFVPKPHEPTLDGTQISDHYRELVTSSG